MYIHYQLHRSQPTLQLRPDLALELFLELTLLPNNDSHELVYARICTYIHSVLISL